MEKEIQKAREKLANLQDSKRSFRQLYEGAARLLGIKVEVEEDNVEVDAKDTPKEDLKDQIQIDEGQKNKDDAGLSAVWLGCTAAEEDQVATKRCVRSGVQRSVVLRAALWHGVRKWSIR